MPFPDLLNFTFFYSQFLSEGEQSSVRAALCWCWVRAVLATVCNYHCQRNPWSYWVPFREDPWFPASCTTGLGTAQTYPRWVSSCGRITNESVLHFGQALCLAWARGSLWGVFGVMLSEAGRLKGLYWRVSGRDTLLTRREAGSAWFGAPHMSANKINHTTQSCII